MKLMFSSAVTDQLTGLPIQAVEVLQLWVM